MLPQNSVGVGGVVGMGILGVECSGCCVKMLSEGVWYVYSAIKILAFVTDLRIKLGGWTYGILRGYGRRIPDTDTLLCFDSFTAR